MKGGKAGIFCQLIHPNVEWATLNSDWAKGKRSFLTEALQRCFWTSLHSHPPIASGTGQRRTPGRLVSLLSLPQRPCFPGLWIRTLCWFHVNFTEHLVAESKWVSIVCPFLWDTPGVHTPDSSDALQDKTQVGEEKIKEKEKGSWDFPQERVSQNKKKVT